MFFLQISRSHLFLVYKIYLLEFYDFTKEAQTHEVILQACR